MFKTSHDLDAKDAEQPAANDARVRHHFAIRMAVDPSALARVIELFSILSLVPETVQSRRLDGDIDELQIDVVVGGLSQQKAHHLQLRIGQFPGVQNVLVEKDVGVTSELDYREAVYQMRRAVRPTG